MQVRILTFLLAISFFASAQDSTFNKTDLNSVAKVFDLTFTPKEMDTLFTDVKDNLYNYKSMHKLTLNNATPLSMWQTPIVSGMKFNTVQQPIKWGATKVVSLPANKNELAFYSIEQLAYLIKNKKITSVDLTRFFIERIKNYGDTLQCLISLTENLAFEQAKHADAEIAAGKYKGMLHGIPYSIKDLYAEKATRTTRCAAPYKAQE
ncbi:MAG: amidase family protein, partial [Sediminibacterium sp.]